MNEYPRLISFRMDWLDLLAVWGTLKNLLQHHSSKASILRCSAFFIVQLSQSYMTTGKTIALTRRTFVDKVMYLLFNMLSGLVITFLPRSKGLLISWLQSPSTVILEPRKIKSATVFCFFFFVAKTSLLKKEKWAKPREAQIPEWWGTGVFKTGLLHIQFGGHGLTVLIDNWKLHNYKLHCIGSPIIHSVIIRSVYI